MRGASRSNTQTIHRLADEQHGLVSRRQLLRAGFAEAMIRSRLREGRLRAVHPGVYATGPWQGPRARMMAGVLAAGEGAAVARRTAAELWGFGPSLDLIEVVRSFNRRGREHVIASQRRRLKVYRSRFLPERDVGAVAGIPVTSVARTLLDLASMFGEETLDAHFTRARGLGLVDSGDLKEVLSRGRGWRGSRALARVIARWEGETGELRSELEARFVALCREHGIPAPEVNARIAGIEVDCLWRGERLVVELDGRTFHDDPTAFERDRDRDARLVLSGFRVIRLTYRMVLRDSKATAARVAAALASGAAGYWQASGTE